MTFDEHNYNLLEVSDKAKIYPEGYLGEKLEISRKIYQINNGAAGAPYYVQEELPWSEHVSGFTTQNAVVFIFVSGQEVKLKVINPDTLELIHEKTLNE